METSYWFEASASPREIKQEKEKARALRKSQWWRRRIDRGVCHYCRRSFGPEELTMDHVVPLARGGKTTRGNVVPACKDCNSRKKYMLPVEWQEYLQGFAEADSKSEGREGDESL